MSDHKFDPKKAQEDRKLALSKLRDATEEDEETSEVIERAVAGGVRGAMASIREGDDSTPPIVKKMGKTKKTIGLVIAILSALGSVGAALSQLLK